MCPGLLWPIESLPTGANGKLDRNALLDILRPEDTRKDANDSDPRIAAIREMCVRLLGHSAFIDHDDFFDVGGDSLLAMALVEQIESAFGVRIPFDQLLLHGASAHGLADTLERLSTHVSGDGPIILRHGVRAEDQPVLLANLLDGGVSDYRELIRLVDPSEPVITVRTPGVDKSEPCRSIESLADALADEFDKASNIPCLIVGYSFGAQVAIEIARRLRGRGSRPDLVLIEPDVSWAKSLPGLRHVAHALVERRFAVARTRALLLLRTGHRAPLGEIHIAALARYRPEPLEGCRTLIITAVDSHMTESAARWEKLVGEEVTQVCVPGDHLSVVKPPAVAAAARAVIDWRAQMAG